MAASCAMDCGASIATDSHCCNAMHASPASNLHATASNNTSIAPLCGWRCLLGAHGRGCMLRLQGKGSHSMPHRPRTCRFMSGYRTSDSARSTSWASCTGAGGVRCAVHGPSRGGDGGGGCTRGEAARGVWGTAAGEGCRCGGGGALLWAKPGREPDHTAGGPLAP